ncbi:uncharacterized protein CCR75_007434 [Bremia lactucae]|uniref:PPPDE domain-containing protein n=1 Tax=Bremia lactucae TaxID=4779 RepID=A0A976FJV3_BRELC|nr:hypothetical protein CCR75_007434 [Bremia lactucae]
MGPRTAVRLNIYNLMEANEFMAAFGLGIFHSGVEIAGEEFSYASGAGVFSSTPRHAPGATFRESIDMGYFQGSSQEAHHLAFSLCSDFEGNAYNLFTKYGLCSRAEEKFKRKCDDCDYFDRNCNTYADYLCQLLLNKSIPAYVNRAAYLGSFLSCLLPADLMDQAPVGDPYSPSRITSGAPRGFNSAYIPFAGSGQAVGTSSDALTSTDLSSLSTRREKVRLAVMRRQQQ